MNTDQLPSHCRYLFFTLSAFKPGGVTLESFQAHPERRRACGWRSREVEGRISGGEGVSRVYRKVKHSHGSLAFSKEPGTFSAPPERALKGNVGQLQGEWLRKRRGPGSPPPPAPCVRGRI